MFQNHRLSGKPDQSGQHVQCLCDRTFAEPSVHELLHDAVGYVDSLNLGKRGHGRDLKKLQGSIVGSDDATFTSIWSINSCLVITAMLQILGDKKLTKVSYIIQSASIQKLC